MKKLFISTFLLGLTAFSGLAKDLTVTQNSWGTYTGFRNRFRAAMTEAGISDYSEITSLKIITEPNTYIGNEFFSSQWIENQIVLEESLRDLLKNNLEVIDFSEANFDGDLLPPKAPSDIGGFLPGMPNLREVYLPEGLRLISGGAFKNCPNLQIVSIPNSVINIGDNAFRNCPKLIMDKLPEGLLRIGDFAFWGENEKQQYITISKLPEGVSTIGESAFNNTNVSFSEFPEVLTSLGIRAFRNTKVSFTEFPASLTPDNIGIAVFVNCDGITEFTIPESMVKIPNQLFWPADVNLTRTFYCYSLTPPKAGIEDSKDKWEGSFGAYNQDLSKTTLYVLSSAVDAYKSTEPYSKMTVLGLPDYHKNIAVEHESYETQEGSIRGPNIAISTKDNFAYIILTPEEGAKNVVYALDNIQDNPAYIKAMSVEALEYNPADTSEDNPGSYIIPVPAGKSADLYIKYDNADGNTLDNEDLPYSVVVTKLLTEIVIENVNTESFSQPFSTTGTVIFADALKFESEISTDDFTVTIVPENNASGWATGVRADYETGLAVNGSTGTGLYDQWLVLDANGNGIVDGYYSGASSITGKLVASEEEENAYNIEAEIPCSGVYYITVAPIDGVIFSSSSASTENIKTVVYPNLYALFGADDQTVTIQNNGEPKEVTTRQEPGFNVQGFAFENTNDGYLIKLPDQQADPDFPSVVTCYIPGTYFASSFTVREGSSRAPVKRKASDALSKVYYSKLDLSSWDDSGDYHIAVDVTKNNASHTYDFTLTRAAEDFNTSTGVEAIGSEDGEAVYYNLQGVRVDNPRTGIFIERRGNSVRKVVVK